MAEQPNHVPTIDEMIELPRISNARISPDGSRVAYVVSTPDWKQNEHITQIWLVGAEGIPARQLTYGKCSSHSPRWSPDGDWLVFLSKREPDEHTQIYRLSVHGGEAERMGELDVDAGNLQWSPDGKQIVFTAEPPKTEAEKEREEKYGDYQVDDVDYRCAWLWSLNVGTKKCRKLAGGEKLHIGHYDWSPDGTRIAFDALPSPNPQEWTREKIYTLELSTLEVTELTGEGCYAPHWSPDGRRIAYTQNGDPSYIANNFLCAMNSDGSELQRILEDYDEFVEYLLDWAPEGVFFSGIQRTAAHLFLADPKSKQARPVTPDQPQGWVSYDASFDREFRQAALVASDADHLPEVILLNIADGSFLRLTSYTDAIEGWQTGKPEIFRWMSTDGTEIEGILTRPIHEEPGQKYPLLVVIHGGPAGTSMLHKFGDYDWRYYPIQQWVNRGAYVLQPNYRGSAGYGQDFRALNVNNLGVGDAWDVLSGVDALVEKGWVDPERVGVMGWSQGGYISAFLTTSSTRFKAVSVGAGISNWVTYYVNTDIHPFTRQYLQSTPWEGAEVYQKTSPITYIKNARTPTLIQHGENDRRVPIPNAYELYQGLKDVGVEAKLVVYQGMPHGITKPRLNRQVAQENLNWFNRWIWGDETPEEKNALVCYVALAISDEAKDGSYSALEAYPQELVQDVYHWARRDGVEFRILGGKAMLMKAHDAAMDDGALEAEDVSDAAKRIAGQLKEQGIQKLKLFTPALDQHPRARIALGCLQVAAGVAGDVKVEHEEVEDRK